MSIHQERPFITWLIGILEDGDLTVGDGRAPDNAADGAGYVVVYSITGGVTAGTIDQPRSDAEVMVQVTSSGVDPSQTRWLVDRVRTLLDAAVPATLADGRQVIWLDFPTGGSMVQRDDRVQPPRWFAPDRFSLGTSG